MAGNATVSTSGVHDPLVDDFLRGHNNADTNMTPDSLHHTLGYDATQAAAGNHDHPYFAAPITMTNTTAIGAVEALVNGFSAIEIDVPKTSTGNTRYRIDLQIIGQASSGGACIINIRDGGASNPTTASTLVDTGVIWLGFPFADTKSLSFSVLLSAGKHIIGLSAVNNGGGAFTLGDATFKSRLAISRTGTV